MVTRSDFLVAVVASSAAPSIKVAVNQNGGVAQAPSMAFDRIALAYDDTLWNELLVPALGKSGADGPLKPGGGNPYSDVLAFLDTRGANCFVCNNALMDGTRIHAHSKKRNGVGMYRYMRAHLVKNAMLVPAGVMAINAAQEARFTYIAV